MTLRLRLVIALLLLAAAGLVVFGFVTYGFYSRSLYTRLDDQLQAAAGPMEARLREQAGLESIPGGSTAANNRFGRGGPPTIIAPETYGGLIDSSGDVVTDIALSSSTSQPALPAPLPAAGPDGTFFTVGSTSGSGDWRVYLRDAERTPQDRVLVAVPLTEVTDSLDRLLLIETSAAVGLLTLLGIGSWLILRRGLRPLEQMATSSRAIAGGDLSQRVSPADGRTEVGQLGLALNTMLDDIEVAFREREATEQRLRQFLADASHELRTPLTSIQGFAELFRLEGEHDHVDLEIILRRIEEESARMKVLVEDLLLLARLDETRPSDRGPVDLAVLAADACSDAVALDRSRPVTLDAPNPLVIQGDQDHLRQAISNLVTNAVHHTPAGSPIEVSAEVVDGYAVVTVRDHGPGLDPDALEHVFDRFWQADNARVGSGVGLGLAIVAGIAAEHGGDVTAANAADGGAVVPAALPPQRRRGLTDRPRATATSRTLYDCAGQAAAILAA